MKLKKVLIISGVVLVAAAVIAFTVVPCAIGIHQGTYRQGDA